MVYCDKFSNHRDWIREMGEINIPQRDREALKAIDASQLHGIVQQCVEQRQPTALAPLKLYNCGAYVGTQFRYFERALMDYRSAKSAKKLADTRSEAQSTGRDLIYAIEQMQARLQVEEKEELVFGIDDHIMEPALFHEQLTVRVRYQWRQTVDDKWTFGTIAFVYDVDTRPNYTTVQPKRKPSVAQQERARQENLRAQWDDLRKQSLYSVRDYFKGAGDGAKIPETFHVRLDDSRGLNNHSTKFWL